MIFELCWITRAIVDLVWMFDANTIDIGRPIALIWCLNHIVNSVSLHSWAVTFEINDHHTQVTVYVSMCHDAAPSTLQDTPYTLLYPLPLAIHYTPHVVA